MQIEVLKSELSGALNALGKLVCRTAAVEVYRSLRIECKENRIAFQTVGLDEAITYIAHMIRPWHNWIAQIPAAEYLTAKTIAMFVAAVLGAGIVQRAAPAKWQEKWVGSVPEAIWCAALLVFCIATIAGESYNPFIYFQF